MQSIDCTVPGRWLLVSKRCAAVSACGRCGAPVLVTLIGVRQLGVSQ